MQYDRPIVNRHLRTSPGKLDGKSCEADGQVRSRGGQVLRTAEKVWQSLEKPAMFHVKH